MWWAGAPLPDSGWLVAPLHAGPPLLPRSSPLGMSCHIGPPHTHQPHNKRVGQTRKTGQLCLRQDPKKWTVSIFHCMHNAMLLPSQQCVCHHCCRRWKCILISMAFDIRLICFLLTANQLQYFQLRQLYVFSPFLIEWNWWIALLANFRKSWFPCQQFLNKLKTN